MKVATFAAGALVAIMPLGNSARGEQMYPLYDGPFDTGSCDRAVAFGRQALERDPLDHRGALILGEGMVCRGLRDDDPWALEAAIATLGKLVVEAPDAFFARLALADALRARFPLSDAAERALRTTRDRLAEVDVGAAQDDLRRYIDQNVDALVSERQRLLPLITQPAPRSDDGASAEARTAIQSATLLAMTGPTGVEAAQRQLDACQPPICTGAVRTLYRAELLRGSIPRVIARDLYREAKRTLCGEGAAPSAPAPSQDCALAELRLRQLSRVPADELLDDRAQALPERKGGAS